MHWLQGLRSGVHGMDDLPFGETVFNNTYQTMPETRWNYWNLILFNEHEREDGTLMWLMRKNQWHALREPGCLAACPRTARSCSTQMASSISSKPTASAADMHHRLPFDIPKMNPRPTASSNARCAGSRERRAGAGVH